jgi:hypothetical protein
MVECPASARLRCRCMCGCAVGVLVSGRQRATGCLPGAMRTRTMTNRCFRSVLVYPPSCVPPLFLLAGVTAPGAHSELNARCAPVGGQFGGLRTCPAGEMERNRVAHSARTVDSVRGYCTLHWKHTTHTFTFTIHACTPNTHIRDTRIFTHDRTRHKEWGAPFPLALLHEKAGLQQGAGRKVTAGHAVAAAPAAASPPHPAAARGASAAAGAAPIALGRHTQIRRGAGHSGAGGGVGKALLRGKLRVALGGHKVQRCLHSQVATQGQGPHTVTTIARRRQRRRAAVAGHRCRRCSRRRGPCVVHVGHKPIQAHAAAHVGVDASGALDEPQQGGQVAAC